MSISYSTLFARLGKLTKWINLFLDYQGTLLDSGTGADEILSEYEARRDLVTGVQSQWQSQANAVAGWIGSNKSVCDRTLSDLQASLAAPNNGVATIVPLLVQDMVANSQSIVSNTISTPTASADGSNVGNGQLVLSSKTVAGIDDERIINETVKLVCITDRYSGSVAGGETFSVTGQPSASPNSYVPQGNGVGQNLRVEDVSNLLANGSFESFSGSPISPTSWTIDAGVAPSNITQETTNVHCGASALKLIGDGTTTTITLHQNPANLSAGKIYAVGVWLRKSGTVTSGSNLHISIQGAGLTTVNLFNADPSTLTMSFVFYSAFFSTPAILPSDLTAKINWTSANTAGASAIVLVDDFVLSIPNSFGNVQYALFRGSADFVKGDDFTVVTANDNAGVFQSFFARFYNTALPSSGSPTLSDSLAE